MAGQQRAQVPRGLHQLLGRDRAHRQRERDLGRQRLRPLVGQVPVVTAAEPVVVLPGSRPGSGRAWPRDHSDSSAAAARTAPTISPREPALAPPPLPRRALKRRRQRRRRRRRIPHPARPEPGQTRIGRPRRLRARRRIGLRARVRVGRRARAGGSLGRPGWGRVIGRRVGAWICVAGPARMGPRPARPGRRLATGPGPGRTLGHQAGVTARRRAGRGGDRLLARPAPLARPPVHQLPQVDLGIYVLVLERYHRAPTIQSRRWSIVVIFFGLFTINLLRSNS